MNRPVSGPEKAHIDKFQEPHAASSHSPAGSHNCPLNITVPPGCPGGPWAFNAFKSHPSISTPDGKTLFDIPNPYGHGGEAATELTAFARVAAAIPIMYSALKSLELNDLPEPVKRMVTAAILEAEHGKAWPGTIVTADYLRALKPEFFVPNQQSEDVLSFTATWHPCWRKPGQHEIPIRLSFFTDPHGDIRQANIAAQVVRYDSNHKGKAIYYRAQPLSIHEGVRFLASPDVRYPLSENKMLTDVWRKWKEAEGHR